MDTIKNGTVDKKPSVTIGILARYYCHELHYNKPKITITINDFMTMNYPRYNPVDWANMIEKYVNKANKYPLCTCDGVWITQNELETIKGIQNKVLERLAFTLLCLAKFFNFRNEKNNNWVKTEDGEIFKMPCINTSVYDKCIRFHDLRELGLIEFAKRVDNLSVQVLYIDNESENVLFINDFRKLGNEWRLYKGEKYIRCAECGILVKQTSKNRKYCKDCLKNNPYYTPMETKTIKCIDCGKEFEVDAKDNQTCRCDNCYEIYRKNYKAIKEKERRLKTK